MKQTPINDIEPLLSPEQIAELWSLHRTTVHRMFQHEPGVLRISATPGRVRRRATLRIPLSVMERVRRRNEVV